MSDNGTIQIVISSAAVVGGIGYILATIWKGYTDFKKYVYENTVKKSECELVQKGFEKDIKRLEDDAREDRKHG